jgi:hypothetical protein
MLILRQARFETLDFISHVRRADEALAAESAVSQARSPSLSLACVIANLCRRCHSRRSTHS